MRQDRESTRRFRRSIVSLFHRRTMWRWICRNTGAASPPSGFAILSH
jgi:hypothetical protein